MKNNVFLTWLRETPRLKPSYFDLNSMIKRAKAFGSLTRMSLICCILTGPASLACAIAAL